MAKFYTAGVIPFPPAFDQGIRLTLFPPQFFYLAHRYRDEGNELISPCCPLLQVSFMEKLAEFSTFSALD